MPPAHENVADNTPARLDAAVILFNLTVFPCISPHGPVALAPWREMPLYPRQNGALIALACQHKVRARVHDAFGNVTLTTHRIDRDDRALELQGIEQFRYRRGLAGFSRCAPAPSAMPNPVPYAAIR
ncbi:hypothetical protein SAMN05444172_9002 [Burkholderia sp. GAS332]|nr:hypothetical protein SAMN05444172_9002 [Burkholderia sp. GAS332]